MRKARCLYWKRAEDYANGEADMIELTEVPCGLCVECRQAASDGVLMAGDFDAMCLYEEPFNGGEEVK